MPNWQLTVLDYFVLDCIDLYLTVLKWSLFWSLHILALLLLPWASLSLSFVVTNSIPDLQFIHGHHICHLDWHGHVTLFFVTLFFLKAGSLSFCSLYFLSLLCVDKNQYVYKSNLKKRRGLPAWKSNKAFLILCMKKCREKDKQSWEQK